MSERRTPCASETPCRGCGEPVERSGAACDHCGAEVTHQPTGELSRDLEILEALYAAATARPLGKAVPRQRRNRPGQAR